MQQTEDNHSNSTSAQSFGAVIPFTLNSASHTAHAHTRNIHVVAFDKFELQHILNVYSRKVSTGDWKDYTIDCLKTRAIFAIFRKSTDVPLYRIEKTPENTRKQGQYSLHSAGVILKRGQSLENILRYFDEKPKLV